MLRSACCVMSVLFMASLACAGPDSKLAARPATKPAAKPAKKTHPETTDPAEARKDPDFAVQGEYAGTGLLNGRIADLGAQVIALGNGKFKAFLLAGGLPGAGWKGGQPRLELSGQRDGPSVVLSGQDMKATIDSGGLHVSGADGKTEGILPRVDRVSPTLGQKPPRGALVLFDGSGLDGFPENHGLSPDANLIAGATSTGLPDNYQLHLEFRLSYMPTALGQARSNSGVYLHDCYEIQVLDSFGLEGLNNECGGFYKIKDPDVNMCLPPLLWQTYDIDFRGPKFDAQGSKLAAARISVRQNGVPIHENVELPKDTPGRKKEGPGPRPIHLQGHGCHVQYRNVWVVPKP